MFDFSNGGMHHAKAIINSYTNLLNVNAELDNYVESGRIRVEIKWNNFTLKNENRGLSLIL